MARVLPWVLTGRLVHFIFFAFSACRTQSLDPLGPPHPATPKGYLLSSTIRSATPYGTTNGTCGYLFPEQLVSHGAQPGCSWQDMFHAVQQGWRLEQDQPFQVPRCKIHWFSSTEACAVLQDAGGLALGFDSLTRHLAQALLTILIGDYENSTDLLASQSPDADHPSCQCDAGYNDGHTILHPNLTTLTLPFHQQERIRRTLVDRKSKFCREHSIVDFVHSDSNHSVARIREVVPKFCPTWSRMFLSYSRSHNKKTDLSPPKQTKQKVPGPLFKFQFILGGLHADIMDQKAARWLFDGHRKPGVRQICSLLTAPGANKQPIYTISHGTNATVQFNTIIQNRCTNPGDSLFDAYTPTKNATSIDGQHYFMEANLVIAQLLLNHLQALVNESSELNSHGPDIKIPSIPQGRKPWARAGGKSGHRGRKH